MPRERKRRDFHFARPGRFMEEADRQRKEAKLEELRAKIQAQSERTGVDGAVGMDMVADTLIRPEEPPEMEWWDQHILPPSPSSSPPTYEAWAEGKYDGVIQTEDSPITLYIQHPVPVHVSAHPGSAAALKPKPVRLTKRETKKLRRQRRAELQKEKQEKIRLGLLPPEAPRVKLGNLMRVLGDQAVQDPTRLEARVRREAKRRADEHLQRNEDRKLTAEQKKEKKLEKLKEDSAMAVLSNVYKIKSLTHPKHKFKVEANAQQLGMTGVVIQNPLFALVIVEGGPKAIKAYKKLMLRRIAWSDPVDGEEEDEGMRDSGPNQCALVWEGQLTRRLFRHFRFHLCPTDAIARERLGEKAIHYWDLAKSTSFSDGAPTTSLP
ncbi:pre-mRNA processing factor 3-domain-containing protein [Piptocephalis cylindrospora]|uniref:Pre-mRNA processing factor 3-domain-containing protein n=1 Tax=Piptocephalis cylindrospora TaxID=1907219 RepID=A0A4P9XZ31_9FUNG|nr:pre-mRNA processing factor 3-domain-containing protein [Piptocephalis cylindrospora]|eukprot:RKP11705.1 pre-mRNA processing factor 3-domain-containing protein [Piptocephalis cylindrospora]